MLGIPDIVLRPDINKSRFAVRFNVQDRLPRDLGDVIVVHVLPLILKRGTISAPSLALVVCMNPCLSESKLQRYLR